MLRIAEKLEGTGGEGRFFSHGTGVTLVTFGHQDTRRPTLAPAAGQDMLAARPAATAYSPIRTSMGWSLADQAE